MGSDPAAVGLEPALELSSYVAAVKTAEAGDTVGYGRRFVAAGETCIGTIPIGYGDGVRRALSNNCDVLIGDGVTRSSGPSAWTTSPSISEPGPTFGGERAVLIGADGDQRQTTEELARRSGRSTTRSLAGSPRASRGHTTATGSRGGSEPLAAIRLLAGVGKRGMARGAAPCGSTARPRRPTTTTSAVEGDLRRSHACRAPGRRPRLRAVGWIRACRVVAPRDRGWQLDLMPLARRIDRADLRAARLHDQRPRGAAGGRRAVDPSGAARTCGAPAAAYGVAPSVEARPAARAAARAALLPVGSRVEAERRRRRGAAAPGLARVAPERMFEELRRILAGAKRAGGRGAARLDGDSTWCCQSSRCGASSRAVHHLDVPRPYAAGARRHDRARAGARSATSARARTMRIRAVLAKPLANQLTPRQALRFGALLHDIAKPQTRGVLTDGRVTFMGHDVVAPRPPRSVLTRLRLASGCSSTWRCSSATISGSASWSIRCRSPGAQRSTDICSIRRSRRSTCRCCSVADRLATRGRPPPRRSPSTCGLARAAARRSALPGVRIRLLRRRCAGTSYPRPRSACPGPAARRTVSPSFEEAASRGESSGRDEARARARADAGSWVGSRRTTPTASSARSSRRDPGTAIVAEDDRPWRSWTSIRRPAAHCWSSPGNTPPTCRDIEREDLQAVDRRRAADLARVGAPRRGWRQPPEFDGSAAWQTVFHFHMHVSREGRSRCCCRGRRLRRSDEIAAAGGGCLCGDARARAVGGTTAGSRS